MKENKVAKWKWNGEIKWFWNPESMWSDKLMISKAPTAAVFQREHPITVPTRHEQH